MNRQKKASRKSFHLTAALLIASLSVYGCSGSSDTSSTSNALLDSETSPNNSINGNTTTTTPGSTEAGTDNESDNSENRDPASSITTRINFQITVPAHMSDELQVRLRWGSMTMAAQWIGDEFWSVATELPIDTENLLVVTFLDRNGDISLGEVKRLFETGTHSAEDVVITAEDFDTDQWDDDADGVSNIDELRLGTDPQVSDDLNPNNTVDSINLRENITLPAAYYEPQLKTLTLPVDIQEDDFVDNLPYHSLSTKRHINISSDGNGSYETSFEEFIRPEPPFHRSSVGTRTQQDKTVSWSGTQLLRSSSIFYNAYLEEVFDISSTINERELIQESTGTITGKTASYEYQGNITEYNYSVVMDLDSMDTENTCAVMHGSFYITFEQQVDYPEFTTETLTRNSADENWLWTSTTDGETTQGEAIEINRRFFCNFQIY